jgi:hypothetical protein
MMGQGAPYRVLLPQRIFEEAQDKEHLKRLILEYMKHYPNYVVKSVKDGFAICIRE